MQPSRGLSAADRILSVENLDARITFDEAARFAHIHQGQPHLLDPIRNMLDVQMTESHVMQPGVATAFALVTVIGFVAPLIYAKRAGLLEVRPWPDTCQRFFRWDELTIRTDQKKDS